MGNEHQLAKTQNQRSTSQSANAGKNENSPKPKQESSKTQQTTSEKVAIIKKVVKKEEEVEKREERVEKKEEEVEKKEERVEKKEEPAEVKNVQDQPEKEKSQVEQPKDNLNEEENKREQIRLLQELNDTLQDLLIRNLLANSHEHEIKRGQQAEVGKITRRRIQNELKQIQSNPPVHWKVVDSSQWNQWIIQINMDGNTPFHTLPIFMKVIFPNDYPNYRPFLCLIQPNRYYHPNIYPDGSICEELINKEQDPSIYVRQRIDGFVFILSNANPESPANHNAAQLYRDNYRKYRIKAYKIFRQVNKTKKSQE